MMKNKLFAITYPLAGVTQSYTLQMLFNVLGAGLLAVAFCLTYGLELDLYSLAALLEILVFVSCMFHFGVCLLSSLYSVRRLGVVNNGVFKPLAFELFKVSKTGYRISFWFLTYAMSLMGVSAMCVDLLPSLAMTAILVQAFFSGAIAANLGSESIAHIARLREIEKTLRNKRTKKRNG